MSRRVDHLRFNPVAAALCTLVVSGGTAVAQEPQSSITELRAVRVQGEATPYKAEQVQSVKFVAPLLDTPQTVNIVPAEVLREQNAQNLQQILSNVPGITFSSGEGNAGWGDMFTIRGFSAEQSISYDGVRNSALTSRTDTFNIEQVEVFKGTGSIESGVAAIGGSVNIAEKAPKLEDFYEGTVGLGTARYGRVTADLNKQLGETMAVRLNAMVHRNDVAGRNEVEQRRWGVAPSFAWGLGTPTRATVKLFHQRDENVPDFGVPVARGTGGERQRWIDREYWGGLSGVDTEETTTDSVSLLLEHDFSSSTRVRNQTRWERTKRFTYITSGGRLLNAPAGTQPGDIVGGANTSNYWGYASGGVLTYPSGPIALPRLQGSMNSYEGKILANQTDLNFQVQTGALQHSVATGVEIYRESYRKDPYTRWVPNIGGRRAIDVRNPDTHYSGPWHEVENTDRSGAEVTNIAAYIYDSIALSRHWEVAGGARVDRYRVKWFNAAGDQQPYRQNETVWSGRLGVVYKPVDYGSIYLSYSQATQPSAAMAASRSGGGGNANVGEYSPGRASTWELGTKWDLLDGRLALTSAIFQVERTNPSDVNPIDPFGPPVQYAGKERVRGFEFGLTGNITSRWMAYAGLSLLDGKIIEDESDPAQEGGKMKNVPNATFNLWTTYAFTPKFNGSLGLQYVGKRRFAAGNTAMVGAPINSGIVSADEYMPAYWVANAALAYRVNSSLNLRLNVDNLFDKFYYVSGTSSSDGFQLYGVPGRGRTFMLTADIAY